MKKIPTLFKRDFTNNGMIIPEYSDGTEWVVNGEGIATRKYDGTSVLIRNQKMYKRYEYKDGKTPPTDFEEAGYDATTGKHVGWVQVGNGSEDKWFREAIVGGNPDKVDLRDGTYELLGPKVQGNPEKYAGHVLLRHDTADVHTNVPVEFEALKNWLADKDIEGIVWHHPDGRMVKIKKKDYRLKREQP
jgi:hypothetical protein